jgi:hypothetical protein
MKDKRDTNIHKVEDGGRPPLADYIFTAFLGPNMIMKAKMKLKSEESDKLTLNKRPSSV